MSTLRRIWVQNQLESGDDLLLVKSVDGYTEVTMEELQQWVAQARPGDSITTNLGTLHCLSGGQFELRSVTSPDDEAIGPVPMMQKSASTGRPKPTLGDALLGAWREKSSRRSL